MEEVTLSSTFISEDVSNKDTGSEFIDNGTQTDHEVLYESIMVQTWEPETCNIGVQTDSCNFLMKNFLTDDAKLQYYTGLSTFEFVMKPFAHGEKRHFYWRSFIIVLLNLGLQDIRSLSSRCITVYHVMSFSCSSRCNGGLVGVAYKIA